MLEGVQLPAWSLLAVALVEMRTCGTLAGGAEDWRPYASILPKAPGTVLEWSDTEVCRTLSSVEVLHNTSIFYSGDLHVQFQFCMVQQLH